MKTPNRLTAFSIAAGALSLVLMQAHMARFERRVSGGAPVEVVGLGVDVAAGTALEPAMLTVRKLPDRYVESRHIPASQRDALVGLRLSRARRGHESLLWSDLTGLSDRERQLSELVPHGMRAMSIGLSQDLSALIRPGDRVDILCTPPRTASVRRSGGQHTRTVLENLIVLARGHDLGGPGSEARGHGKGRLTLGLRVQDSRTLADASDCGRLQVTLRHPDDLLLSSATSAAPSTSAVTAARGATDAR